MPHDIRPTAPEDLPELSRFLTDGFHAPADAPFAAEDVLHWKIFDGRGEDEGTLPRSYVAREEATGRIVGHVGVCPSRFRGPGLPDRGLATMHMIDWLAGTSGAGVGASLMRRAHRATDVQFGFGGSAAGRGVIDRGGYGLAARVPIFRRVLRPGYRLRPTPPGLFRAAKDAVGVLIRPPRRARIQVDLQPVEAFGAEVEAVLSEYADRAVFTSRGPDLLNHFLHYPRGGITGWLLDYKGVIRGFAVLAVLRGADGVTTGKLVELLLDDPDDAPLWHASALRLTDELKRRRADVALGFASTAWATSALRASGYASRSSLEFRLRDRGKLIPPGTVFHLTPLEADYAYT
jgi:hypothetical protein